MATVTPNFNWPVPTSTDLVKDGATAIEALGDSIDASLVDLKGGTTGQVLSKTSNTDMDFTWVAADDTNAIQNTIVDAKGDLIAASAADTPARLAVGNNGETLVADSSTSTGLRWQVSQAAGKNAVINGAMTNWQRGTSFTSTGYTADRWYLTSPGSNTVSRSTDAPSGFPYSLKWDISGAYPLLSTYIELPATGVKGQYTGTWTVSFWAKGSASFSVELDTAFNNGSARTDRVAIPITGSPIVALTTTWTKYSFVLDLTSPTINANNKAVEVVLYSASGTNSMYLTGVQFEQGSVSTAFTMAGGTIQGELAACQRYYWRMQTGASLSRYTTSLGSSSATDTYGAIANPVPMRLANPTSVDYANVRLQSPNTIGGINVTSILMNSAFGSQMAAGVQVSVASGLTSNLWYALENATTGGYLGFSAEL